MLFRTQSLLYCIDLNNRHNVMQYGIVQWFSLQRPGFTFTRCTCGTFFPRPVKLKGSEHYACTVDLCTGTPKKEKYRSLICFRLS